MRIRWGNVILAAALVATLLWLYRYRVDLGRVRDRICVWHHDRLLVYILIAATVLIAVCALQRWRRGP